MHLTRVQNLFRFWQLNLLKDKLHMFTTPASLQPSAFSLQPSAFSLSRLIPESSNFSRALFKRALPCFFLSFLLVGCAQNQYLGGAKNTISRDNAFMTVDLVMELSDSHRNVQISTNPTIVPVLGNEEAKNQKDRLELAQAFENFHTRIEKLTDSQKILARNQIQSRLIGASEMACTEFQRNLNGLQSTGNFTLGTISTVLAGAGAIVTQVNTARLLSGSSAIFSGVRSEFNADYFLKQTAAVITKAIDTWRRETKENLLKAQHSEYKDYTVEAAIADAIAYNDGCSLIAGLQRVSDAVAVEDDPGLKRMSKLLNSGGKIKTNSDGLILTVSSLFAMQEEVFTLIKGTLAPDYELEATVRTVNLSSETLIGSINKLKVTDSSVKLSLEQRVNEQKSVTVTALNNLKSSTTILANDYSSAVKQVAGVGQDEKAFSTARADFYAQLAKITRFRQDIDWQIQEFNSKLKTIRDDLDNLSPPQPPATQASDKDLLIPPESSGAAIPNTKK